jgi:hypothetical protein
MKNENISTEQTEDVQDTRSQLNKVTPLSKYLAMLLFVILPFLGGWVGYQYAPEKVVEVEKIIKKEIKETKTVYRTPDEQHFNIVEIKGWESTYPVLSNKNDLFLIRSIPLVGMEEFDLTMNKIEGAFIGDGFRYEKGNLISSEIVIHVDRAFAIFTIEGADPATFEVIDGLLTRDADTLFYRGRAIKGAEPDNVEISNYLEAGIADNPEGVVIIGTKYAWVAPGCNFFSGNNFTKVLIEDLPYVSGPCLTKVQREN